MKQTKTMRRPAFLSLTILSAVSLWACSSPPSLHPQFVDQSISSAKPKRAPTNQPLAAVVVNPIQSNDSPRPVAVAIPVAPIALTTISTVHATVAPMPSATSASPSQDMSLAGKTESGDEEGRTAVGMPQDPLRPDAALNLGDATASQDLWARVRKGFALPELDTKLISENERWYASHPDYVLRMTDRGSRYLYYVVEESERRQMPTELALLPFIESAFNPQAQSSARASGIWQFMPATGKDFSLKQNLFRDDRRDVLASTRAALDYLQRLYRQFGDWHLALAAYNWGEGNVQKAVARNAKQGLPTDYLSLNMPQETRNYVPKLHAMRNVVARPEAFNLTLTPVENHPYFVSVPIQRDMDVTLAARLAGMPLGEFKALNPSQNKPVILAAGTPQVLLPYDNANLFVHKLQSHKGPLASWTAWVVPRTMRPNDAARQVHMSEVSLKAINRIPPKMLVKAGSTLLVPRAEQRTQDVSESLADNAVMALAPDIPPMRRMNIRAGKRDTVQAIARRYHVSPQQVAQWNKTSSHASFQRGQRVVVFVPITARHKMAKNGRGRHGVVAAASGSRGQGRGTRVSGKSARSTRVANAAMAHGNGRAAKSGKQTGRSRMRVASVR